MSTKCSEWLSDRFYHLIRNHFIIRAYHICYHPNADCLRWVSNIANHRFEKSERSLQWLINLWTLRTQPCQSNSNHPFIHQSSALGSFERPSAAQLLSIPFDCLIYCSLRRNRPLLGFSAAIVIPVNHYKSLWITIIPLDIYHWYNIHFTTKTKHNQSPIIPTLCSLNSELEVSENNRDSNEGSLRR